MKKYLSIIKKSSLFFGIEEDEINAMLHCLSAEKRSYTKNEFIRRLGDEVNSIGLLLSGSVHILKEDFWGNRNILAEISPGQVFAESYACMQGVALGVNVVAAETCEILFLNVRRLLSVCTSACEFHTKLIRNLMSTLAEKNLRMNEKLTHLAQRGIRGKLLSYLSAEAQRYGSNVFEIPFNRQQLADYFSVDRSAMSNELCKMRDDGLIEFKKNRFILKNIE